MLTSNRPQSTFSAEPRHKDHPSLWQLGLMAIVGSAVVNWLADSVIVAVLPISPEFTDLQILNVELLTIIGAFGAALVFALVHRTSNRPDRVYGRIATVVLLLSAVPDLVRLVRAGGDATGGRRAVLPAHYDLPGVCWCVHQSDSHPQKFLKGEFSMAISAPRTRTWSLSRLPGRLLLVGLAAAVGLGAILLVVGNPFTRNQQTQTYQTSPVTQGTLAVTVAATGPITNQTSVPLTFKSSGKLTEVDVTVGQKVTAGDVLARVDPTDLQASLDQARATLAQDQATYNKDAAGATPEQAALQQANIAAAQTTLDNSQKSLQATQDNANTNVAAAQADVHSAQVSRDADAQSLQSAQDQMQATLQADQTSASNAQQSYQDQLSSFNASWGQVEQALKQDQVSIDNAQTSAQRRAGEPRRQPRKRWTRAIRATR